MLEGERDGGKETGGGRERKSQRGREGKRGEGGGGGGGGELVSDTTSYDLSSSTVIIACTICVQCSHDSRTAV